MILVRVMSQGLELLKADGSGGFEWNLGPRGSPGAPPPPPVEEPGNKAGPCISLLRGPKVIKCSDVTRLENSTLPRRPKALNPKLTPTLLQ